MRLYLPGAAPVLRAITKGGQLQPVLIDHLDIEVVADGKPKGCRIPPADLNAMLATETFLERFLPLYGMFARPVYLPGYELPAPGYHDCGEGDRVLYTGPAPDVVWEPVAVNRFLDAMAFKTAADRTNAVAAALTVQFRQLFRGEKPLVVATCGAAG